MGPMFSHTRSEVISGGNMFGAVGYLQCNPGQRVVPSNNWWWNVYSPLGSRHHNPNFNIKREFFLSPCCPRMQLYVANAVGACRTLWSLIHGLQHSGIGNQIWYQLSCMHLIFNPIFQSRAKGLCNTQRTVYAASRRPILNRELFLYKGTFIYRLVGRYRPKFLFSFCGTSSPPPLQSGALPLGLTGGLPSPRSTDSTPFWKILDGSAQWTPLHGDIDTQSQKLEVAAGPGQPLRCFRVCLG